MKSICKMAAAASVALVATGAHAQSTLDGSISLQYIFAPDDSFDYQSQIDGSLTFGISPSFDIQLDLGLVTYEGYGFSDVTYGIHAIYALNDSIDLGVFFSRQYYNGNIFHNGVGIEAGYQNSALRIDGFFSVDFDETSVYYDIGAEVGYTFVSAGGFIGDIEVIGGTALEYGENWNLDITNFYGGVNMNLGRNLMLTAIATSTNGGDYTYYTAGITYTFGKGSRFAARDFSASFPGY